MCVFFKFFRLQVYECHKHPFIPERLKETRPDSTADNVGDMQQVNICFINNTALFVLCIIFFLQL